jgi:hypothetical protein
VFLSHQQAFGTAPTACIRFAGLSRIEILHILLEHSYDSRRNENVGSVRRLHRRQSVARSQDLLSPLRQFQRRVAVVGSVAHLIAKDPGSLPAMSRDGDCGKDHARDGQEAVSQVAPLLDRLPVPPDEIECTSTGQDQHLSGGSTLVRQRTQARGTGRCQPVGTAERRVAEAPVGANQPRCCGMVVA